MQALFKAIFFPTQYIPHGHCYLWQTPLVGLHVASDLTIALAYFSIPMMMLFYVRRRKSKLSSKVLGLFSAFIFLCGAGHLIDIWTLWYPAYWLSGIVRALTALISAYTALELINLLPTFLALRTAEELEQINQALQSEIAERKKAEKALQQAHNTLELRIRERTEELIKAKETAEVASRAKSTFLAKISHELRTPLNAILGFTQLMGHDATLVEEHRHHLKIVNQSGLQLLGLINNVLDITKLDVEQTTLHKKQFDLPDFFSGLEEIFQNKAESKNLVLQFRYHDLPRYIQTDEGKLQQILTNILDNAIKYTDQGSIILTASMIDQASISHLKIMVADTGIGMSRETQQQVFKPFFQADGSSQAQGTGLGLAICQGCLDLMDGKITITSEPDQGTTISLLIPVEVTTPSITPLSPPRRILRLAATQPAYRILIAEDAPTNRLLLRKVLSTVGFDVKEAVDGQQAITRWKSWQPDLILMDMQMPVMDGYQATQHIKDKAGKTAPPIIALTASTFINQQRDMATAGCDACIHKPFNRDHLLATIGNFLHAVYDYEISQTNNGPPSSLNLPMKTSALSQVV